MTAPKTRRQIRFEALHKYFKEKHNGKDPCDAYEAYILELIVALGEVYDDNQNTIRAVLREGRKKNAKRLDILWEREEFLDQIGTILRRAISISIPLPAEGVKRGLKTKLVRAPSKDELDLLEDLQAEE